MKIGTETVWGTATVLRTESRVVDSNVSETCSDVLQDRLNLHTLPSEDQRQLPLLRLPVVNRLCSEYRSDVSNRRFHQRQPTEER